jgi:hypothetical protein
MHASQETKRELHTLDLIMIFYEHYFHKQIGYLNSSRENIQFQKSNHLKCRSYDRFKINKISTFFPENAIFKISSKLCLDIFHYKKIKWICVEILMVHILHQIHADIYIFNKIFNEHKLAQLRGLLGVKDKVA